MLGFPLGILSAAGAGEGEAAGAYELLETQILGSNQASITFSSLATYASSYKHLQIRAVVRSVRSASSDAFRSRVNGVSTTSYSWHALWGSGSSVASEGYGTQDNLYIGNAPGNTATSGIFSAHVVDLLDPFDTTKFTTIRSLGGGSGTGIYLNSGLYQATTAVGSIQFYMANDSLIAGSRISLYGIKGS